MISNNLLGQRSVSVLYDYVDFDWSFGKYSVVFNSQPKPQPHLYNKETLVSSHWLPCCADYNPSVDLLHL